MLGVQDGEASAACVSGVRKRSGDRPCKLQAIPKKSREDTVSTIDLRCLLGPPAQAFPNAVRVLAETPAKHCWDTSTLAGNKWAAAATSTSARVHFSWDSPNWPAHAVQPGERGRLRARALQQPALLERGGGRARKAA